jgi:nicotinate-nucleotide pyrophosphorylase (carboxylating)
MLDNMDLEMMRKAVNMAKGSIPLEASGNVNLENVRQIAETGVDFISSGALTHSAPVLDISMKIG